MISLQVGDRTYALDPDQIGIQQAMRIEKFTGLSFTEFAAGVAAGRPDDVQALLWLIFDGGDLTVPIGTDPETAGLAAQLTGEA